MSCQLPDEIVAILHDHGCPDITEELDLDKCGMMATFGGAFGDVYPGRLINGRRVAIKCARLFIASSDKNHDILKVSPLTI